MAINDTTMNPDRTVLVTGASKGIGQAIALRAVKAGFDVVIHYHHDKNGALETQKLIKELNGQSRLLTFDISQREAATTALITDIETHGTYYGVVLNAGIACDNAFPSLSGEDWDRVIGTNLDGFYNVLHPLVMPMVRRKKPGRIVTLSSVSGVAGNRGQVNYSASKAGIIGATKALAIELAKREITVNCVAPGLIQTQMTNDLYIDDIEKSIPLRRMGQPNEVAATVAFLLSEEAGYITRQVISVNGGLV